MKKSDLRYYAIKRMLEAGEIKTFTEIFDWIPYTVVARDFGTNNNRMKKMKDDPGMWKMLEVHKLADLIDYDKRKLDYLAAAQVDQKLARVDRFRRK